MRAGGNGIVGFGVAVIVATGACGERRSQPSHAEPVVVAGADAAAPAIPAAPPPDARAAPPDAAPAPVVHKQLLELGRAAHRVRHKAFRRASTVVFGYGWGRWIPLYCFDAKHKAFAVGEKCLATSPRAPVLGLVGGGTETTTKRGRAEACGYTPQPERTKALVPKKRVDPTDAPSDRIGVWPAKSVAGVHDSWVALTPTTADETVLAQHVRSFSASGGFRLDVTGDGVADRMFRGVVVGGKARSVRASDPDARMIALIGPDFQTAVEVFASTGEMLIAASDLDGNGAPELVFYETPVNEGYFIVTVEGMVYTFGCMFG